MAIFCLSVSLSVSASGLPDQNSPLFFSTPSDGKKLLQVLQPKHYFDNCGSHGVLRVMTLVHILSFVF